jgi:hypothetical protein
MQRNLENGNTEKRTGRERSKTSTKVLTLQIHDERRSIGAWERERGPIDAPSLKDFTTNIKQPPSQCVYQEGGDPSSLSYITLLHRGRCNRSYRKEVYFRRILLKFSATYMCLNYVTAWK